MSDISISPSSATESKTLGYVAGSLMMVLAPAGVILSYIDRKNASSLLASHYNYLIGTFWKGMLCAIISLVLSFVLIGFVLSFATGILYIARCIKSLVYLHRDQAIENPRTWLF